MQPPEETEPNGQAALLRRFFRGSSAASQGQAGNGTDTAARAQADYPATPIKLAPTLKPADLHFAADTILANIEGPNRVLYAAAADAPAYDHSAEKSTPLTPKTLCDDSSKDLRNGKDVKVSVISLFNLVDDTMKQRALCTAACIGRTSLRSPSKMRFSVQVLCRRCWSGSTAGLRRAKQLVEERPFTVSPARPCRHVLHRRTWIHGLVHPHASLPRACQPSEL